MVKILYNYLIGILLGTSFSLAEKNYPQEYSVNLMWINKQTAPDQRYLYPSHQTNNFGLQFFNTILTWAKKNLRQRQSFLKEMLGKPARHNNKL